MNVVGVVGDRTEAMINISITSGSGRAMMTIAADHEVSGVVMSPLALPTVLLNAIHREMQAMGLRCGPDDGYRWDRRTATVLAAAGYEPLFYVEPVNLSPVQLAMKRASDLVGSALVLVLASPIMPSIAAPMALTIMARCSSCSSASARRASPSACSSSVRWPSTPKLAWRS